MRAARALIVVLCGALGCSSYQGIDHETLTARTMRVASGKALVSYYPVTHQNKFAGTPIVLFDPIFIKKDYLHRGEQGGLIAYLNKLGHPVWLVHLVDYKEVNLPSLGTATLPAALAAIKKKSGNGNYVLGGLSLGGQTVLHFLSKVYSNRNQRRQLGILVRKVFFLGVAMDLNYPGSILQSARAQDQWPTNMAQICAQPQDKQLCNFLRSETFTQTYKMINHFPELEQQPQQSWANISKLDIPALFIAGKIDSIASEEAVYPTYLQYGSANNPSLVASNIPRRFFVAGQSNKFRLDYDHFALFAHSRADGETYKYLESWLRQ